MDKQIVTQKLHENGYSKTKEDEFGNIVIKGEHGLNAYINERSEGVWSPVVRIEWVNIFVIVPALAASLILSAFEIKGILAMLASATVGFMAGTLVMKPKKEAFEAKLNAILNA